MTRGSTLRGRAAEAEPRDAAPTAVVTRLHDAAGPRPYLASAGVTDTVLAPGGGEPFRPAPGAGPQAVSRRAGIQVIERAAEVMRSVAREGSGLTVAEIADLLALPRSTTHRIVAALRREGFVRTERSGRVHIGPALVGLAQAGRRDLTKEAAPFMQRLSAHVHETVDLAVLDAGEVLLVDRCQSPHTLRVVAEIGARLPLHCTANGKALLASLPPADAQDLLPPRLEALTPNTITDRDRMLREIRRVQLTGVALDREEHAMGVSAAGTAVRDATGDVVAITVVAPSSRFAEKQDVLVASLQFVKSDLQALLGVEVTR